jgi:Tfp pilus assembly protein PilX
VLTGETMCAHRSSPEPLAHELESEIDMNHRDFRRRLSDDIGFVLPTAMIILLILTVLIGAAITVAAQTSTSTTRDNNTKAALEAAEAGLQAAAYRLTKLEPTDQQCITSTVALNPGGSGYCASSPNEKLGNGATFEYWDTIPLTAGQACTGSAVTPVNGSVLVQRCVTSIGRVNGIQRRAQQRVFSLLASKLFEVEGILGYESVSITNNGKLSGELGTNGTITLSNGVTVTKADLGPGGKVEGTGTVGTVTTNPLPYVRPLVPIGVSATSASTTAECVKPPVAPEPPAAGKNCDVLITNGINKIPPPGGDPASSGVTFNSSTRSLAMGNGSSLELYEGIYNFCDFQVSGNNATLKTAVGARVEIFIDSAQRAGSGCQTDIQAGVLQAGKLVFKNGLTLENPNKDATYLQIYVYDGSGGPIEFKNNSSSQFYGTIVAPYSKLKIENNGEFTGAIMANEVELSNNFKFKWDPADKDVKAEIKPHYARTAWEECPPTYTGTNPQQGC